MKHHRRAEPVIKDLFKERISVSLFAGCGGACVGMRAATGNEVDVAINHDKVAIAVHRQNHPTTEHRISDVFEVKPQSATRGRRVGHLHASPDCRHFSRAAGAAPKSDSVRSLADVVIDFRAPSLYGTESADVAHDVREWAIANGRNKKLRIALCGYEGEHEMPADWQCVAWKAAGGYAAAAGNAENSAKERIWFSPHCARAEDQADLFSHAGGAA